MNAVRFPEGFQLAPLQRKHARREFDSGEVLVNDWLATKALQQQEKHLSNTKVLLNANDSIAGFYTLASGQVDFGDLPVEQFQRLPRRMLPVAVLAWLGVNNTHQGQGLGRLLVAQALRDCYEASKTFPFIAVILDCLTDKAKSFYKQWDFAELPNDPYRLFLSANRLSDLMLRP